VSAATTFAEPVERQIAADMIKRAAMALPALVVVAALGWGVDGALSAAFAVGLVSANFAVAATSMSWAAKISVNVLMATVLAGFMVRMALITVAVLAVRHQSWVATVPLGITIVLTHIGLLFWETRHLSVSLAFPGLKPKR
jgi:hypothetical protein